MFCDLSGKINLETDVLWKYADYGILIIFAADYFLRFILSEEKRNFVRENIPDLIAIIPFSAFFKVFRIAKLLRVIKITKLLKLGKMARLFALFTKFAKSANRFLKTNGLVYMLAITGVLVMLGAIGIYAFERGQTVETFGDALWWSFVTTTTVGYGDISPATGIGRIIAGVLMLCGIGTIGLLTGTIATYFLGENHTKENYPNQIIDLSDVSNEKFNEILDFIEYIKKK